MGRTGEWGEVWKHACLSFNLLQKVTTGVEIHLGSTYTDLGKSVKDFDGETPTLIDRVPLELHSASLHRSQSLMTSALTPLIWNCFQGEIIFGQYLYFLSTTRSVTGNNVHRVWPMNPQINTPLVQRLKSSGLWHFNGNLIKYKKMLKVSWKACSSGTYELVVIFHFNYE